MKIAENSRHFRDNIKIFLKKLENLNSYIIIRDGGKWWSKDHHLVVVKIL